MTSLTDRYVAATLRELPRERREEIGNEVRESIADQVEARVAAGDDESAAEFTVISEMGDPMRLAASYAGRQLVLIGTSVYPTWRRLLIVLVSVVTPIVAIVAGAGAVIDQQSLGSVIGAAVGAALMTAIQVAFWLTLVFAILERTGALAKDPATRDSLKWTPKDLPAGTSTTQGRGDLIGEVVSSTILIGLLVYQTRWLSINGQQMSISNPDADWWVLLMVLTLGASILLALSIGVRGRVSLQQALVNLGLALIAIVPTVYLASADQLLNPTFVSQFAWVSENAQTVNVLICLGFILGWGIDVAEKFVKAYRAKR